MGPWIELQPLPYAFPALRSQEDYPAGLTVLEDYVECLRLDHPYYLACLHVFLCINVGNSGSRSRSNALNAVQTYSQYYVLLRISNTFLYYYKSFFVITCYNVLLLELLISAY